MNRRLACLTVLATTTVLVACSDGGTESPHDIAGTGGAASDEPSNPAGGSDGSDPSAPELAAANWRTIESNVARATPSATVAELQEFSRGNHDFAFDLYAVLRDDTPDNLLLSPTSIRTAFAMTYAGAEGETATEMEATLHYPPGDATHAAFNALDRAFEDRNLPAAEGEDAVELSVVHSFWAQSGYPWLPGFLDTLGTYYGSGVESVDFDSAPQVCRELINRWVARETHDRIQDLLSEASIDAGTVAVLVNAVYLEAPWESTFADDATHEGTFYRIDGGEVVANFMFQVESFGYAAEPGYQAVELPFRGEDLAMAFIVPDAGTFADFEADFDAARFEQIIDSLAPTSVALGVPKFEFASTFELRKSLRTLGMELPFSASADFSKMLEGGGIYVDDAYHQTFIAIDEAGAEAAAATAVLMGEISLSPSSEVELTVDRPFFVAVRDVPTNNLLFFGRVLDPTG